jgi:hypothetical protein
MIRFLPKVGMTLLVVQGENALHFRKRRSRICHSEPQGGIFDF